MMNERQRAMVMDCKMLMMTEWLKGSEKEYAKELAQRLKRRKERGYETVKYQGC